MGETPSRPPQPDSHVTCPSCGAEYDTRYLSETCRATDEFGYLCRVCNTVMRLGGGQP